MTTTTTVAVEGLRESRAKDTQARRQRVLDALERLQHEHADITVSSVARAARVHRSFLHRHPELVQAVQATAQHGARFEPSAVSTASLQADLANAIAAHRRLAAHTRQLEVRLSELLGTALARAAGLSDDHSDPEIRLLTKRNHELDQLVTDLRLELAERTEDLDAARRANRTLIATNNQTT